MCHPRPPAPPLRRCIEPAGLTYRGVGSLSMSEENFSDEDSCSRCSRCSLVLAKLQRGNLMINTLSPAQHSRNKPTLHHCTRRTPEHAPEPAQLWAVEVAPAASCGWRAHTSGSQAAMPHGPLECTRDTLQDRPLVRPQNKSK